MTFVKSGVGVALFAFGIVFALAGVAGIDPARLFGGVVSMAAGVYVMQRL